MINRIRVINLERSLERLTRFIARHPGLPVERFPAVDGARLDRDACIESGVISPDNEYIPGALGNALSHIALWRECSSGSEPFHIMEDDAVLRDDFPSMASALLDTLNDWDIVLWTHNFDWPLQIRPVRGVGVVVVQYDHEAVNETSLNLFRPGTETPFLAPLVSAAGFCCYSVSPRGAARMLVDCLPIGRKQASYLKKTGAGWINTALDVEMSCHYDAWRAYVAIPPVAITDNDKSTSTVWGH